MESYVVRLDLSLLRSPQIVVETGRTESENFHSKLQFSRFLGPDRAKWCVGYEERIAWLMGEQKKSKHALYFFIMNSNAERKKAPRISPSKTLPLLPHDSEMSFPSDKGSVKSEKGEVHEEQADSAANSITSRQQLAKESGIKPIFIAKVNRINEAISECGMGKYVRFNENATETCSDLFTFLDISGSSSSPGVSDTLQTTSGCTCILLATPRPPGPIRRNSQVSKLKYISWSLQASGRYRDAAGRERDWMAWVSRGQARNARFIRRINSW